MSEEAHKTSPCVSTLCLELDLSRREFRLLSLQPGRWDDPIFCSLRKASLDDSPVYDALSYVWGDLSVCDTVHVNNSQVPVTANLFDALRRLRDDSKPQSLWIDSLCIIQSNNDEKAHQVRHMGSIYSQSRETLLWLGDYKDDLVSLICDQIDDRESGLVSDNLASQAHVVRAFELILRLAKNYQFPRAAEPAAVDSDSATRMPPCPKCVAALETLMGFAWWTRSWTVQEVVLPKVATVVCGALRAPWSSFEQAVNNLTAHHYDHGCLAGHFKLMIRLYNKVVLAKLARDRLSVTETLHLDVLSMFRGRLSTDPRDQIFALLGLCPPAVAAGIEPDYSLDHRSIYADAVFKLIRHTKLLLPLWRPRESHRDRVLPSWVPDWTAQTNPETLTTEFCRSEISTDPFYDCSRGQLATLVEFNPILGSLVLQGSRVDTVVKIAEAITLHDVETFPRIDQAVQSWRACFSDSQPYPRGGSYEEAFWRLMCGNRIFMDRQDAQDQTVNDGGITIAKPEKWQTIREAYEARKVTETEIYSPMILVNRRFFVTQSGLLGLGPVETKVGDTVHVLFGGHCPFILRPVAGKDQFQFLGDGYVHGIMDGEAVPEGTEAKLVTLI